MTYPTCEEQVDMSTALEHSTRCYEGACLIKSDV